MKRISKNQWAEIEEQAITEGAKINNTYARKQYAAKENYKIDAVRNIPQTIDTLPEDDEVFDLLVVESRNLGSSKYSDWCKYVNQYCDLQHVKYTRNFEVFKRVSNGNEFKIAKDKILAMVTA